MMVIGGGIVCGLVVLAGWWFFSAKMQAPPADPLKIASQSPPQREMVSAGTEETGPPESPAAALEPAQPAADIVLPPETAGHMVESTAAKIPRPSSPAITLKAPVPVDSQAVESAIQEPAAEAAAVIRAPEAPTKVAAVEIPVLNDPDMKLQAITWSKDPQKRIVVINNRILRQGEVVYGYRIDTINQDDIVLSDAGKKWQLLFRIK